MKEMSIKDDILGALKSAMSRGYSIEIARQTLINSGYPAQEIDNVISIMQTGETPQPQIPVQQQPQQSNQKNLISESAVQKHPGEKKSRIFIIILIILFILLVGILIAFLIFKEQLVEIFSSIFP